MVVSCVFLPSALFGLASPPLGAGRSVDVWLQVTSPEEP